MRKLNVEKGKAAGGGGGRGAGGVAAHNINKLAMHLLTFLIQKFKTADTNTDNID